MRNVRRRNCACATATATVTATVDGAVLRVPHAALTQRLTADAGFAGRFYRATSLFLADRLRGVTHQLQRSGGSAGPDDGEATTDEVNVNVLENVHLAGQRFLRILEELQGS